MADVNRIGSNDPEVMLAVTGSWQNVSGALRECADEINEGWRGIRGGVEKRTRVRMSPPREHRGVERGLPADRSRSRNSTLSSSSGMIR